MIILDTNVVSEMLKAAPEPRVLVWLENQPPGSLFTTVITRSEILYGILSLPEGQRRRALWSAAMETFNEDFAGRTLDYDSNAADAYAEIGASRRAAGRPIAQFDASIAALARSHGATLATRNERDFEGCGITVINPWVA